MSIESEREFPRELDIDEDKHEKFKDLADTDIFKNEAAPMKSVFLYSLALGWANKKRIPLKKKTPSIPSRTLRKEEKWLFYAIAFAETHDINIILDTQRVAEIAEEYANGGIDILYNIIKDPHDDREIYRRLDEDIMKKI